MAQEFTDSLDEVNQKPAEPVVVQELPAELQIISDRGHHAFAQEIHQEFQKLVAFNWALERALARRR